MMTAEERVAPRVPGGGMPQDTDKNKPLSTLEDPLLDAVDGTFLSALLQHALDNLSATASTCRGEDKTEALNSEAETITASPRCAFSNANHRDIRNPAKTSRTCSTSLTTSLNYSSTVLLDKSRDGTRNRQACKAPEGSPTEVDQAGDDNRDVSNVRLPQEGTAKVKDVTGSASFHGKSQCACSETGATNVEGKGCVNSGTTSASPHGPAVAVLTPPSCLSKSNLNVDNLRAEGAALMQFHRGVEAEETAAPDKNGKVSVTLKVCQQFPPLRIADATRNNALLADNAAVSGGLPCGSLVVSRKPTPATHTSTGDALSEDATETALRRTPFHILLTRLCGDGEAPLPSCLQGSFPQRHEDEIWQRQLSRHQQAFERASGRRAQYFPTAQPQTFVSDISPVLQENCGSTAMDDGVAAALQELLTGRSQGVGATNLCDAPGALLQQQSVGRALLTRLASLQVQQTLLRYTVSLPPSPSSYHMRTGEPETHSSHEEVVDRANNSGQTPSLSQQFSHDEWPVLASKKGRSAITHTHLHQSELFSLMQNHTTCVFHFVIRALCLLANCCPTWAAGGDEVPKESAGANAVHNTAVSPTAIGSRKILHSTTTRSYVSREKYASVVTPVHEGSEPSVSRYAAGSNVISAGKHAEPHTVPHCKDWTLPRDSESGLATASGEDAPKSVSLVEVGPGELGGSAGISSYRWHWMHVVSFLTHPELLSVYHSTLAPLLSLVIQNAQSGSAKHCARIESLDTSSSHDDELSTAGEHVTEKAPQSASQRQNTGPTSSNCCGAGSWLVVRQVLCDLDDLRFLHDPSFAPCPQRQDSSLCAHLQQQPLRLGSHSHHASCVVLSQSTPLLCCSASKCNDQCPGAFYCGTALLRSSIFFGSFLEASRALAVWPQYLAAAAAAALPLSSDSARCNRSACLTTDEEDGTDVSSSLERRRHTRATVTKDPGRRTTLAPRPQWHCGKRTDEGSRVTKESLSHTRTDLTDAARGVAACILKHVDLNKLDSTELLALLKLTEEASSLTSFSPCEEHGRAGRETRSVPSPATLAAIPSPVSACNRSRPNVAPFTQSEFPRVSSPADPKAALKRPRGERRVDLESRDQSQPLCSVCPASTELCPFTGGENGKVGRVVSGGDVPCGDKGSDTLLTVAVSTDANPATFNKRASRCPDEAPSALLVADGKIAVPEETWKTLLRFSPLFSPRKQQNSVTTLSEHAQSNTSKSETKVAAVGVPQSRGQRQPVESPLGYLSPALCDLLCPATSQEKASGVACAPGVGLSAFSPSNEEGNNVRDNLHAPGAAMRENSLSPTESAALGETALLHSPHSAARCQHSTISPLRGAFPGAPFSGAAGATGDSSYEDAVYRGSCRQMEIQRNAASATQELIPGTLESKQASAFSGEHTVSNSLETKFYSLAVAVAPTQHVESQVGTCSGTKRLTGDEAHFKEKGESRSAVSALDIIEHERALSLVAAGVRNTRKRFRLQSVRRKTEARLHYGVNCVTLRTDGSSWNNKAMAHVSLQSVSPKQQRALPSPQSPGAPTPAVAEASQNAALCRFATSRVGGGVPAGRRRNATGITPAASGNNNGFNNTCHVRSPVKGIYYDSYKKLWRVQWNSSSGASQQTTTNISVSSSGHGGAGRRVSRSFSCARLGFEAAKARAVAWMLSGGHVGDGGLTDVFQRASPENQANNTATGTASSGVSETSHPSGKHEHEKNNTGQSSEVQKVAERQKVDEREQKEKLLFANPKLFLERVEAFYVRNGLYGLQCGNGPAGGPGERQRSENKEWEEQQRGTGACSSAASQAANSRKGNGGTGGLRIVSVLSLDDMLDIVQGKKITMSFPYAALKQASADGQGKTGKSEIALAANYARACYVAQNHISRQRPLVQEGMDNSSSQPCFRDTESTAESARKKSRTREAVSPLEKEGAAQTRLSKSSLEEKVEGEDAASGQTGDEIDRLVRETQECSPS